MAKVLIYSDELYPCYDIEDVKARTKGFGVRVVPDDVLERWRRVMREFSEVQAEMHQYEQNPPK